MPGSNSPLIVPPGQYLPFAVVTDTDHTAWIIIATALGLSCILVFSIIKVVIRWVISPRSGLDETCLAAATIIAVIQSSIILGACADGLGKSIELVPEGKHVKIQQMYYVSVLFFIVTLGLSKVSVAFLLLRLTPRQHHMRVFYAVIILIATWTVASTFDMAFQCNFSHPWILIHESCPGAFLRWQVISAFDIAFEICLVGMTIYLVWDLHSSLENQLIVIFVFSMRLPLIIAIAMRLANFDTVGLTTNPTLLEAKFIVWTQTELNYSIIAATIPSLRPFMKTLATNYGAAPADGSGFGSGYASGYGSGRGKGSGVDAQPGSYQLSNLRPQKDGDEYKYRIWSNSPSGTSAEQSTTGEADVNSLGSSDSQRMIIKKDTEWEVVANS